MTDPTPFPAMPEEEDPQTQAEREDEYQPPECRAPNPFIGMSREEYLSKCRKLYGEETFERMMRNGQI